MFIELSRHFNDSTSVAHRQELELLMPKWQTRSGFLDVWDGHSYFTGLFGDKVDQKDTYST